MERDLRAMAGPPGEPEGLRALRWFRDLGYGGSFSVLPRGHVRCETCHAESAAKDVTLERLERVDVATDPDDQQLVAALRCPGCGAKGTTILSYGPGGSGEDAQAMEQFRDERTEKAHERIQDGVAVES